MFSYFFFFVNVHDFHVCTLNATSTYVPVVYDGRALSYQQVHI